MTLHHKAEDFNISIFGRKKCRLYPFTAKRNEDLMNHMVHHRQLHVNTNHKMVMSVKSALFKCPHCTFSTKWQKYLARHMLSHGKMEGLYKCRRCPYRTNNKKTLSIHELSIHLQSIADKMQFKCTKCEFSTTAEANFKIHMLVHKLLDDTERRMTNSFKNSIQGVNEISNSVQSTLFKCSKCFFESNTEINLRKHHTLAHKPEIVPKFKCNLCGFESKMDVTLIKHNKLIDEFIESTRLHKCGQNQEENDTANSNKDFTSELK